MKKDFYQEQKSLFEKLELFIPVVTRVHGNNHNEIREVGLVFDDIKKKVTEVANPQLDNEFKQLREITNQYTIPNDVCESYEAVYNMLEEVDEAYTKTQSVSR